MAIEVVTCEVGFWSFPFVAHDEEARRTQPREWACYVSTGPAEPNGGLVAPTFAEKVRHNQERFFEVADTVGPRDPVDMGWAVAQHGCEKPLLERAQQFPVRQGNAVVWECPRPTVR